MQQVVITGYLRTAQTRSRPNDPFLVHSIVQDFSQIRGLPLGDSPLTLSSHYVERILLRRIAGLRPVGKLAVPQTLLRGVVNQVGAVQLHILQTILHGLDAIL